MINILIASNIVPWSLPETAGNDSVMVHESEECC